MVSFISPSTEQGISPTLTSPRSEGSFQRKVGIGTEDVTDPYVTVSLGDLRLAKTSTIDNDLNPLWEERFHTDVACHAKCLTIEVKDKDTLGRDDFVGRRSLNVEQLLSEKPIEGWLELLNKKGKPNGAAVDIDIQYKSAETQKQSIELPNCYFPLRTACDVTLYQDAHTPHCELFEKIELPSGRAYQATCAFKDIVNAMQDAQKFIYLTGWSVFTQTLMLREEGDERITVGELLKRKAEEGVQVLGMVWDEKLSTDLTPGLMGTHDEETARYFSKTKVKMVLVPRRRDGFFTGGAVSTCYTHHQKSVVVDAEGTGGDGRRRLVAFVGGLDLTDGRWDTPNHELFGTLKTYHKDDFYNHIAMVRPDVGPRQPWHDIHSRVTGRAACDVMQNFVERWRQQVANKEEMLVEVSEMDYDLDDNGGISKEEEWSVQMFRSINAESASFDLLRSQFEFCLTGKKRRNCDDSIHRAYTHHIRRAKRFIYIENQYFQGSCNFWRKPETNANHLIPAEITTKIIQKIRAGQRFAAYIVIPMFPEGDPSSGPVQEMLYWQRCTMETMYTKIAAELKRLGRSEQATDYLNFYCLGNREDCIPDDLPPAKPNSQEATLRQSKRLMIYVHSKMMICDDEVIILGSANINQRSMGGNRDTEIAIGAQQNEYTMQKVGSLPKGKVHAFRMALWAEHLASVQPVFQDPSSRNCVCTVNDLAQKNWLQFTSQEPTDMQGHLMTYPVHITEDGSIENLIGHRKFVDTQAPILGTRSSVIPHKLTT